MAQQIEILFRPMMAEIASGGMALFLFKNLLVVALGQLFCSLISWFSHWVLHLPFEKYSANAPLRWLKRLGDIHEQYHHTIYDGPTLRRPSYILGEKSCNHSFGPFVIFTIIPVLLLPFYYYPALLVGHLLHLLPLIYFHEWYHTRDHWLARYKWFRDLRRLHDVHHVIGRGNYGSIGLGLYWDRLFGSYYVNARVAREKNPSLS